MIYQSPLIVLFQGCAILVPSVGSSVARLGAAASPCLVPDLRWVLVACCTSLFLPVGCVSAGHKISSTGFGMLGREDRHPPTVEEKVTEVTVRKVA